MNADAFSFTLCGTQALALPTGALFLPAEGVLVVSDLHLGKSERWARRRGVMLPPYESRATLDRLAGDVAATRAGTVVALGDSFDDLAASDALDLADRATLGTPDGRAALGLDRGQPRGRPHRPRRRAPCRVRARRPHSSATRRCRARPPGEVSGHWHPKHGLPGFRERRRCFLIDARRVVMPAYGTYTGGLDATHPPLRALFGDRALAVLTGAKAMAVPLPSARPRQPPRPDRTRIAPESRARAPLHRYLFI